MTDEEIEALAMYYEDCQHDSWTYEGTVVLILIDKILQQRKKPNLSNAELVLNPS